MSIPRLAILLPCALLCGWGHAEDRLVDTVSAGIGEGRENRGVYWLGLRKKHRFGFYETAVSTWTHGTEDIHIFSLSPVFTILLGKIASVTPYIEVAVGLAYISDTTLGRRDLTTHYQFEDRLGLGLRFRDWNVSARYMHYSNADIEKPNAGMDLYILSVGIPF